MLPCVGKAGCYALALTVLMALPAYADSLGLAVKTALARSADLQSLNAETSASRFGQKATDALSGPTVGVTGRASMGANRQNYNDGWDASVSATQAVLDGGYARSQQSRSRFALKASEKRAQDQALIVSLQTIQTYLEVQRCRGLVRIVSANRARLSALESKVQARVAGGVASQVDAYETAAQLDAAELAEIDAQSQLADAVVNYQAQVGKKPRSLKTEKLPEHKLPRSIDDALHLAKGFSPRIMAVSYDALAADAAADGIASERKPKVDLNVSAGPSGSFNDHSELTQDLSAQISFRFDLYDGGAGEAKENQARMQAQSARLRALSETRSIEREMRQSWNAIHVAKDRTRVLLNRLHNSRQSLKLALERYNAGIASLSQLLDLNDQVASAEAAWLNEGFAHKFNVYRVLAGTGRLLPALQIQHEAGETVQ
jgi:outer membrane protein, adhesin transport system